MTGTDGGENRAAPGDAARLGTGAGVTLAGRMTGRGLHMASQVALARLLGPEAFGLYAIGWTIVRMVGFIVPLGLDKGVLRFGSMYWKTDNARLRRVLLECVGLATLSGLAISVVLYTCAPWVAGSVFHKPELTPVIRWFTPAFALVAGMRVSAAATRVSQRMTYSVYSQDLAQPLVNLILIFVFFIVGWQLFGAVAAGVISFAAAFALALIFVRRVFPEAFRGPGGAPSMARQLIAFSIPTVLAGMFAHFTVRVDRLLVGSFRPAGEVGVYQAASQTAILFATIMGAFNGIFYPMIARLYHQKEMVRLRELFKISTKWGLYLSIPLYLVVVLSARDFLTVLFGGDYGGGAAPLVILATAQLVNVGTGAVGPLLVMTGHQIAWFWISAVALTGHVGLSLMLIPRYGLVGAAISSLCGITSIFALGLFNVRRSLGAWPYDARYWKGIVATAAAAGAVLLLASADWGLLPVQLLVSLTAAYAVFITSLAVLGLDAEDRELIAIVRQRFAEALGRAGRAGE